MQYWFETTCLVLFLLLMAAPGLYGLHLYALMWMAGRRLRETRRRQRRTTEQYHSDTPDHLWPRVTTQIPLYNELPVARRVIEAVAAMDYPRDRHQIQVLDDSTDGTRDLVDRVCRRLRAQEFDITVVRRNSRTHYKAGALEHGLAQASGEYVAIFDADFVPDRGFLRRLIPLIDARDEVCCVQARWAHLNQSESWITEALALGMDGHFGVEQPARGWNGFLLNFNGTAGVWRRASIDDPRVGGWSGDTLTEDLDLSYRAQLAGWKIEYCLDEAAPAEVPADVNALKSQQRRWATGSIQTARKLLPAVWKSDLSLLQKLEATMHLTQYCVNLFMVLMALFGRSLLWLVPVERYHHWLSVSWIVILIAAAAPSIAYIFGRRVLGGKTPGLGRILHLIALGFGLSLNNTLAIAQGLFQNGGEFVRTPKSGSVGRATAHRGSYAVLRSRLWIAELALGAFCLFQWICFLQADRYFGGTFLLIFALGLFAIGLKSRPRSAQQSLPAADRPAIGEVERPEPVGAEFATAAEAATR